MQVDVPLTDVHTIVIISLTVKGKRERNPFNVALAFLLLFPDPPATA
jgi:hypothetical protein